MSAIRRRTRAVLGLPALDDPDALTRPRTVPWHAAPLTFAVALVFLVAFGVAIQKGFGDRTNWQVNAPAIAGLIAILSLAPASPRQAKARNALLAAIIGLLVGWGSFAAALVGHTHGTAYNTVAFGIVTGGALAGCLAFTAITHVGRTAAPVMAAPPAVAAVAEPGETDAPADTPTEAVEEPADALD